MSYRDRQRLADIQAAIDAIRSHLQRGTLADGLVFDAVRIRLGSVAPSFSSQEPGGRRVLVAQLVSSRNPKMRSAS
jgi:hypothetical protein